MKYFISFLFIFYSAKGISQTSFAEISINSDSTNIGTAKQYFKEKKYRKTISICKNLKESTTVFNLIADSYNEIGDYNMSVDFYEKIIQLNLDTKDLRSLFKNYVDIAKVHKKLSTPKNYQISVDYIKKAIELTKIIEISELELHSIFNNLGNYYSKLNDKPKAIENHLKAFEIAKKINNNRKTELSLCNIGNLYFNGVNTSKKDLITASKYYNKSLQYGTNFSYYNYLNIGIISYLQDSPKEAIDYFNNALNRIASLNFKPQDEFPTTKAIQNSSSKDKIVGILFEKYYSYIKLYEKTRKELYLEKALKTIELADFTLDLIFIEIENTKSQLFWRKRASSFYILGVHISHLLHSSEKALYFTEKNKALLLLNSLHQNKFENTLKLPKEITNRSIQLKKNIYYLNHLSQEIKNDSIKKNLFDAQRTYEKFQDSIANFYPEYDYTNTVKSLSTIKDVQEGLVSSNTLVISYIWDKTENQYDGLFGLAITKDTSLVFKISNLKGFSENVETYRDLILKPFNTPRDIEDFQKSSYELYTRLFPNETVKDLVKNHTKLILIPDNDLQYIPFESLITEVATANYLIKTHEISYTYSLSFLKENKSLNRKAKKSFIGFAPSTFDYDDLQELPRSNSEIETIKTILNGDNLIDQHATKENFFNKLNNYKIIHLSTHANANDSIAPWIAFKDDKLYLSELYTSKTQADLVVLSACKSSLGKMNSGEGVFSLARGFFYSGANSVISSLWNVNDKSAQEITTNFYRHLKKGSTKSQALRLSKLNYLNTHSLSEASPYFWSSLILIGDDTSIAFSKHNWIYIIFVIMLLLIIFLKKYKNKG